MTSMPMLKCVLALLLVLTLPGAAVAGGDDPILADYRCEDGTRFQATFLNKDGLPAEAVLVFPDRTLRLPIALSGSGSRYAKGETVFWIKGDDASLTMPERSTTCSATLR